MNKMGEENGNERYLVNVSKLEKLMEEKRNEQNVKRIRALFKNSDIGIDVRAEDALDTAYSTYTTIISKKSATKKTLQLLADYLKLSSFKELVAEDNSMIEREEEREDVISNVTEHMEGLDSKIVNMLSEFSEQLYPIDKLKSFTDEHSIAYMRVGYEKYMVNIPLSAEWRSLFVKPGARIYVINTDSKKNLEDEIKKGLISRLKRHCTNKGESKDREVQELVEKRKLVQIKSDFYKKIIAESAMQMNMDKLNNAIKFDADDEIEYIPLGYNEYRVILPLKKDYCIQLGLGSSVQLDISFEEDPVEAEDDFREMIENQFYSEYIEGEQDLDPDVEEELEEIIEEMWEMPIRKITFIDWLDSEENLKWLNQCYVALWQVLFLRGEYDEIQRTIADLYYACEKFEELGIPVPFKKFI